MQYLKSTLTASTFFILYFTYCKILFLLRYINEASNSGWDPFHAIWKGIELDISTLCMILYVPTLVMGIQLFFKKHFFLKTIRIYYQLILFILALVSAGEITLYKEWGVKLNYKIFVHLSNPSEVVQSAHPYHYITFFVALSLLMAPVYLLRKYLSSVSPISNIKLPELKGWKGIPIKFVFFLLCIGLLVLGMRGGVQPIPINQSQCYFSKNNLLNEVAVNPAWNLVHSVIANSKNVSNKNPYDFYSENEAINTFSSIHLNDTIQNDSSSSILKIDNPNIVFLILESWSSDIIKALGGMKNITPEFNALIKDGFLFTNIHATGKTSDEGVPAIISGFHSLPITTIVSQPSKYESVPCISKELNNNGYNSSFFFGGQLIYGNLKGFLYFQEFDKIIEQKDIEANMPSGRLGIHDEYMLDFQLKELNKTEQPFFSTLFTLSSHPPYDMPIDKVNNFSSIENLYLNSINYTDKCLGNYFEKAKKMDWYKNTLFVLVADHSHKTPMQWSYCSPSSFKIPLLFYGEVLKDEYRGGQNSHIGSQVDIPATILGQLNIPSEKFIWSKNLLDKSSPEFAFYSWYDGYGWVRPNGHFAFENRFDRFMHKVTDSTYSEELLIKEGRSYLQYTFQKYLNY